MRTELLPALLLMTLTGAWAQNGPSVVNVTQQSNRLPRVAPGQVVHLTVHGMTTQFDANPQRALTFPIPTDFRGLSVSMLQTGATEPVLLPLLYGSRSHSCAPSFATGPIGNGNRVDCPTEEVLYDLVVQIPYDLVPNAPGADNGPCQSFPCELDLKEAVLTVLEDAGPGVSLLVHPVEDQVHIINTCTDNIAIPRPPQPSQYVTYPCYPAISHADGSGVSADNPARSGEVLVAYAHGLGAPDQAIDPVAGTPIEGVPLNRPITVSFTGLPGGDPVPPDHVGLVGGNVGLYQVNFTVPALPAGLPPCGEDRPSNLTLTIQGTASMDQASFCAQP